MADSVKISELPSIGSVASDDVLIVNDTSSNTTCKMTISQLQRIENLSVSLINGLSLVSGTITATVTSILGLKIVRVIFTDAVITNTGDATINLAVTLSARFAQAVCQFNGFLNSADNIGWMPGSSFNNANYISARIGGDVVYFNRGGTNEVASTKWYQNADCGIAPGQTITISGSVYAYALEASS